MIIRCNLYVGTQVCNTLSRFPRGVSGSYTATTRQEPEEERERWSDRWEGIRYGLPQGTEEQYRSTLMNYIHYKLYCISLGHR